MHTVYKRYKGSGMSEVLVDAGVINGGSVDAAMRGKHYRRGVKIMIEWRETMIYIRMKPILPDLTFSQPEQRALKKLRDPLNHIQPQLHEAHVYLENSMEINQLVLKVYEKPNKDMGDFWLSYLEMTDPVAQNMHAWYACIFPEYVSSSIEVLGGMAAYNNHEYTR